MPGESLTSFVRRHAQAMGYDRLSLLLSVLSDVRLPLHLETLSLESHSAALACLLKCDSDVLGSMTVHRYARQLLFNPEIAWHAVPFCDSATVLRFFSLTNARLCPACLKEGPGYERLVWTFKPLPICLDHRCPLIERCPQCQLPISARRMSTQSCRCGFQFTISDLPVVSTRLYSACEAVSRWLNDSSTLASGLVAAPAAFHWLERLFSAVLRTPAWRDRMRTEFRLPAWLSHESVAWLAAANITTRGFDRLAEFLAIYEGVAKHRTSSTGASRALGLLHHDAYRLEEYGYSEPAQQLRSYLTRYFTRGHINRKNILFREEPAKTLNEQRPWLTQTAAAKLLHLRLGTVTELIRRGVLIGRVEAAGARGRTIGLVSIDSVDSYQRTLNSALTVRKAAARLGVDRHRVLELIASNDLSSAVRTRQGWLIPESEVCRLMQRYSDLPPLVRPTKVWISAREATRRFGKSGINFVRLWRLIQDGMLDARRCSRVKNLQGLLVDPQQLYLFGERILSEHSIVHGYPLERLAQNLIPGRPLKGSVLRKWIKAGLLIAKRRKSGWHILSADVERFRATFCLADEACRLLRICRQTLTRWEAAGDIAAIYSRRSHAGAGASVFRRSDIAILLPSGQLPAQ